MLIEDGKLNIDEFKSRFRSFSWLKVPRELGVDHKDFFYIAEYNDDDWKISIKTRPSMYMSISETYKHCDVKGNKIDPNSTTKYEFGSSIEVKITENTLKEINSIAKELEPTVNQELDI